MFGLRSPSLRLQKFELSGVSQNFAIDPATDLGVFIDCVLMYIDGGDATPVLWGSTANRNVLIGNMADGFGRSQGSGVRGQTTLNLKKTPPNRKRTKRLNRKPIF